MGNKKVKKFSRRKRLIPRPNGCKIDKRTFHGKNSLETSSEQDIELEDGYRHIDHDQCSFETSSNDGQPSLKASSDDGQPNFETRHDDGQRKLVNCVSDASDSFSGIQRCALEDRQTYESDNELKSTQPMSTSTSISNLEASFGEHDLLSPVVGCDTSSENLSEWEFPQRISTLKTYKSAAENPRVLSREGTAKKGDISNTPTRLGTPETSRTPGTPETPTPIKQIQKEQEDVDAHELTVEAHRLVGSDGKIEELKHRRIVDICHVIKESRKLENHECHVDPARGHYSFSSETRHGLASKLIFICTYCHSKRVIHTVLDEEEINMSAVSAMYSVGKGHDHLEEILTHLRIPSPAYGTFRQMEDKLGKVWMDCMEEEIVKAGKQEQETAKAKGNVQPEGTPFIPVVGDAGWSHRSYGHNYTAKSGCGVIIGKETKKLLYLGYRNKYCSICSIARRQKKEIPEHICYKNWKGSSGAMEPDMIVEGFNQSQPKHGLKYKYYIGDGDSSVMKDIQENVPYGREVQKLECINHLMKNVKSKLFAFKEKLTGDEKKFFTSEEIEKLTTHVRVIIDKCAEEGADRSRITKQLKNVGRHCTGDHTECEDEFCKNSGEKHDMGLNSNLAVELSQIVAQLTNNTVSLLANETTNLAESFMHLVAKFTGGKQVFYGRRASFIWRTYGAGLLYTYGQQWRENVWRYIKNQRKGVNEKKETPPSIIKRIGRKRMRRNILHSQREVENKRRRRLKYMEDSSSSAESDTPEDDEDDTLLHYSKNCNKPDLPDAEINANKERILSILAVDDAKRHQIEQETIGQADNLKWHDERHNRLTASNFGLVCKRRPSSFPGDLVGRLLYQRVVQGAALKYGVTNERPAIEEFEKACNKKVQECGIFIDQKRSYLGASPDGLVEGEDAIVEVKCPYSLRNTTILDAVKDKTRKAFYLREIDDVIQLHPHDNYMYQIQGELAISQRSLCYFIVWTPQSLFVQIIPFDEAMWKRMLPLLEDFYLNQMLTEIADPRGGKMGRKMPIRNSKRDAKVGAEAPKVTIKMSKKKATQAAEKVDTTQFEDDVLSDNEEQMKQMHLRNGLCLPPMKIAGEVDARFINTCPFDSLVSIIANAMLNNETYRAMLEAGAHSDVLEVCTMLLEEGDKNTTEIYHKRAEVLLNSKIAKKTDGEADFNCQCNISAICDLFKSTPSGVRTQICTDAECDGCFSRNIPYFDLDLEDASNLKSLPQLVSSLSNIQSDLRCSKCGKHSRISEVELGAHLLLLVDGLMNKRQRTSCRGSFKITDLPLQLKVNEKRYTLSGVVRFIESGSAHTMGHYTAYVRKHDGTWELFNDLHENVQNSPRLDEEINPHLLVFTMM